MTSTKLNADNLCAFSGMLCCRKRQTLKAGSNALYGRLSGKDYGLFDSSKGIPGNLKVFNFHN
jgi:hypothetical protein